MLNIRNLHKTFNRDTLYEKKLYKDVNLSIKKGEFITVIGSNGAGKSTLFKLISNALQSDQGSIIFGENDTTKNKAFQTAKRISAVVQDPKLGTVGGMTVFENLAMAQMKGKKAGLGLCVQSEQEYNYKTQLAQFNLGLEDKLHIQTKLLSGGQRQVLSLLMATMNIPELLLLDEHTAALDPKTSEKIMEITDRVIKENNLTCLMITHKLEDALRFGNRLIMIHEGQILLDLKGREKEKLTIDSLLEKYNHVKGSLSDRQLFS